MYRHPTGIQTPNRYTDTQQVYRHPTGIQTPNSRGGLASPKWGSSVCPTCGALLDRAEMEVSKMVRVGYLGFVQHWAKQFELAGDKYIH